MMQQKNFRSHQKSSGFAIVAAKMKSSQNEMTADLRTILK
jgi:hypothetical protein